MASALNRRTVYQTAMNEFNARRKELDLKNAETTAQMQAAQKAAAVRIAETERQREYAVQTVELERLQKQQSQAQQGFAIELDALQSAQAAVTQKGQVQQGRYQDLIGAQQQKGQAATQRNEAEQTFNNMVGGQAKQGADLYVQLANQADQQIQQLGLSDRRRASMRAAEAAALGGAIPQQSSSIQQLASVSQDLDNFIRSAKNTDKLSDQERQQLEYVTGVANTLRSLGIAQADETLNAAGLNEQYANAYADASLTNIDATAALNREAASYASSNMSQQNGISDRAYNMQMDAINRTAGAERTTVKAETSATNAQLKAQQQGIRSSYNALSKLQSDYFSELRRQEQAAKKEQQFSRPNPTNPYYAQRIASPSPTSVSTQPAWLDTYIPPKGQTSPYATGGK